MASPQITTLIHLAGFTTGIVLYGMLVVMTARDAASTRADRRATSLPLLAAVLGLIWNLGAVVVYGLRDFGIAEPAGGLVAIAFAALGFLPAVVVHSAQPPEAAGWRRLPVPLGYTLSAAAAAIFAFGDGSATTPSSAALLVLTVGYLLLVTLVVAAQATRAGGRWGVTAVALASFAATAMHLGHDVSAPDSWLTGLLGHHASIPLVLVILYQDYRFAFADLFLRRALALMMLVAVAVLLHVTVATPLMSAMQPGGDESLFATAGHLMLWVATALAYPAIRRLSSHVVDRVVLRRGDYAALRSDVGFVVARAETPEDALAGAARLVAAALGESAPVTWRFVEAPPAAHARVSVVAPGRNAARVDVPTSDRPVPVLDVGPLPAGQRLLSDEVVFLEGVATLLARRIDVMRVTRERFDRDLREREILQLATESELRALRAQLNPHFLFNALTTLGYLMQSAPDRALGTLFRLTELLRAVLRGPAGESAPLGEELDIVDAYLAIERERFQERLQVRVDVPEALRSVRVPPLLLQPLVENAIKHGISPLRRGGSVSIAASLARSGNGAELTLVVQDTGAGLAETARTQPSGTGVGLRNIEQRLLHLFGPRARLQLDGAPGRGTTVTLVFPVEAEVPTTLTPPLRSAG